MSDPTLITFIAYFILLLGIGLYFYYRSASIDDYLLGGRAMGTWVTALSAQASDMSGWLLMALPGAIYLGGLANTWIAIGLFAGTVLNWRFVSARLRLYTQRVDAITLPCFFESRFRDPTGLLRILSAIIILILFSVYASSGLKAAGLLFESTFQINYAWAVVVGGAVIIVYTFLGGFLAVCWTDLLQGGLMVVAITIVPLLSYRNVGGATAIREAMADAGVWASLVPDARWPFVAIASSMAWGLGYFGQPHILVRFMSIKSVHKLRRSMSIAIVWVFLSLSGAVAVGLVGVAMYKGLSDGREEKVFIYMIESLLNPWFGGILLAAIFSAIMSTIDSQLLVSSSALSEDFYVKAIRRQASTREVIWVGRGCVILISLIALVLALNPESTILSIVSYAWGGFGAAFGPLILFSLYSRRTTWQSGLAGMIVGIMVLVLWKETGLGDTLYEIVPGFLAGTITIGVIDAWFPQKDKAVISEYNSVMAAVASSDT